jgi:hypothetical protein
LNRLVYFNEKWQGFDAIQGDFGVLIFKSHNLNRSKRLRFNIVRQTLLSSGLVLFM